MEMKELLQEAGNLEKKLKQLSIDVENKETQKINFETDIKNLSEEKNKLAKQVSNLKETILGAVSSAVESERVRLKEIEEHKTNELGIVRTEKDNAIKMKRKYIDLSEQVNAAIKKNQQSANDLDVKHQEADALKENLLGVMKIIKDCLNEQNG